MSIRILNKLLGSAVKKGTLEVISADGSSTTFGEPTEGFPVVSVKLADNKVARDILLDPRLGAGECFMDGRLILERGGIMELVQLLRMNNTWERGGRLRSPSAFKRAKNQLSFIANSFNRPDSSKRNVAHHYDIGNDLYRLFLDEEHWQ